MKMMAFELWQVKEIVGMDEEKIRNWSNGRPLKITPSVRQKAGPGKSNLYALEDLYRLALANELHKAGMFTKRIAEVLEQLPERLAETEWIRIWLPEQGEKLRIRTDRNDPPALMWQTVHLSEIVFRVNERVASCKL
jgi:hypothetical protein